MSSSPICIELCSEKGFPAYFLICSTVSTVMLLNFNINFMEMSLNAFLWLDLNKAFYFQIFIWKWQPYPISYHRNDTQIVFQRKFSKIASVHYGTSVWHLPWLLTECNSPEWVVHVQFATHWKILRSPLSTVDSLPGNRNKWQSLRKENIGANPITDILLKHKGSPHQSRRKWLCYMFTLNDF